LNNPKIPLIFTAMDMKMENLSPDMLQAVWVLLLAGIAVWLLYANTARKLFLNVYWNFVVVNHIANSLNNEFFDRKIAEEEMPGKSRGILYAWMYMLSHIPFPGFLLLTFSTLSVVYFIQYWVKLANFKNLLLEHNKIIKETDDETARIN
jgi:hypothetical protein